MHMIELIALTLIHISALGKCIIMSSNLIPEFTSQKETFLHQTFRQPAATFISGMIQETVHGLK